ncbi:MAG: MBL fold metallo-hydrolase [Myxococcota bacterium]|nr:MBL fold metallo-hydrolase [Myxococcota bacterium]
MTSQFELHTIDGYIETMYLAVYKDKILVLDAGCKSDVPRVVSYITHQLGRSMGDVKLAIASHIHPDHAGGADAYRQRFGIPIAAPEGINWWYRGPSGSIQHAIDTVLTLYVAKKTKKPLENIFVNKSVTVDYPLANGDPLPFFEDWLALDTPGHTTHDMVFYNASTETLYAADVIIRLNGKYVAPFPVLLRKKMKRSLSKLTHLKVKRLATAHGGLQEIDDIQSVIQETLGSLNAHIPPGGRFILALEQFTPELHCPKKRRR